MNRKFWMVAVLAIPLALSVVGCSSDDDNDSTAGPDTTDNSQIVTLDATSYAGYRHFSFATGDTVAVTDPETNTDWDIAFKRYEVKLNGGAGGPGSVVALDLGAISFDELTAVPDTVTDESYTQDAITYVVDGWYSYDPESHTTPATLRPFVLRTPADEYVKFRILEAIPSGMDALGTLTIEYEIATGTSFTGVNDTVTVTDNSASEIYIDFSTGGTIDVTDKDASTDWDLLFDGYTVMVNGGVSGPGSAGVYPIYEEESDYDSITTVPADMGASYPADSFDSVLSNWWSYDGTTHTLSANGYVYLIKTADAVYKVEVLGYYDPDSGDSGYITVEYEEL